jgi:hypothetical protein
MVNFAAPKLSAQLKTAPTGRGSVIVNFVPRRRDLSRFGMN